MVARKPPEKRQRRGTADLQVVNGEGGEVPALPAVRGPGLLKQTREWWDHVWSSPVAGSWEESDRHAVERLAKLHDDRERAFRQFRKQPLVEGSQGQPVLNPIRVVVDRCDGEIRQLEDRLGLSPMARHKLGITFGEMHRSLEGYTEHLTVDESDEIEDEDDPRAVSE